MKKLLSCILVLALVIGMPSVVYASDATNQMTSHAVSPRYNAILTFEGQIEQNGSKVSCTVSVRLSSQYDSNTTIVLEQSSNGSTWNKVSTLANNDSSSMSYRTTGSKSGLSSAYEYRIVAYLSVYDNDGYEIDYDYMDWYFTV